MEHHYVTSSDGVRLHVAEAGPATAQPIVFLHGWSQSHLSWSRQLNGTLTERFRVLAPDLRGHGISGCPDQEAAYTEGARWADDVHAVLDQRNLDDAVLVGWSYGGYVACDYMRAYGTSRLVGVNFVGWAVMLGNSEKERRLTGRGFENYFADSTSEDLGTSIEAIRGFVRECVASDLSPEDFETMLAYNSIVRPQVRRWVCLRGTVDNTELLSALSIPILVSYGLRDTIVKREAVSHIVSHCPTARVDLYPDAGHSPFFEAATDYNRDLAAFVAGCVRSQP